MLNISSSLFLKIILLLFYLLLFNFNSYCIRPTTIPAIREWNDSNKSFKFSSKTRIIIDSNYFTQLNSTCKTFQEDIFALKGITVPIIKGTKSDANDIFLSIASKDSELGDEGYSLNISESISINAQTEKGTFYGTRTILQILKNNDTINGGTARDWPEYKYRGLLIDNGRKYFSVSWLENHIKELSYIKMNYFHWHFTADEGFGIECKSHPEFPSENYLKRTEVEYLINISNKYHVEIIPEIAMPGHMAAIIKNDMEYALPDSHGNRMVGYLNITSDKAFKLVTELIEEYVELFPGEYWHMGADEFIYQQQDYNRFPILLEYAKIIYGPNAVPSDAILGFINRVDSLVKSRGKKLMIWNDPFSRGYTNKNLVKINTDIAIDYWLADDQPQDVVNAGYNILNCSYDFFYYHLGINWVGWNPGLYENWEPHIFQGWKMLKRNDPNNQGSQFNVWCDNPALETEGHVALSIKNVLRIIAQGLWHSQKLTPYYNDFVKICDTLGRSPGVEFPKNPMPDNLVFGKKAFASSLDTADGSKIENVIDANYNTKWTSMPGDSEWIYVDLESTYNITRVKTVWFWQANRAYKIQTSDDTYNWNTIYNAKDGATWIDNIDTLSGKGRYVRILFPKDTSDKGHTLWEIEVYDSIKIKSPVKEQKPLMNSTFCYYNADNKIFNINYQVANTSKVEINIYDLLGNKIFESVNENKYPGNYSTEWNPLPNLSGIYIIVFKIGENYNTMKLNLIK